MCDDSVDAFRRGVVLRFVVRAIGFKECTVDETIFGVTKCIFGCVAQFLFDASCFVKTCGDESIVVGERLHDVLHIGVAFQELDGEETGGKLVAQGFVLLEEMFDAVDALLQTAGVVDVDVASQRFVGGVLIDCHDGFQQVVDSFSRAADGRHKGHAQQTRELAMVQFVTAGKEFIVDVERHDHGKVHVNQLRCQVEITFQIGGIQHIDDDVGKFFDEIFPDVEFLGRVG